MVHIISTKLFLATDKSGLANQCQYLFTTAKQGKICSSLQKQRPEVFFKKGILKKNWAKFTRKHLTLACFPVNFVKFPKTSFIQNTFGWLLLLIRSPIERGLCLIRHLRTILPKSLYKDILDTKFVIVSYCMSVCHKYVNAQKSIFIKTIFATS